MWAARGVAVMFVTQANFRIHLGATALVVIAGLILDVTWIEWCALVAAIGLVLIAEGFNTAIETVVDLASPEQHPLAGRAKDVAAGAVLLAAVIALVIGALIFVPHLLALF